MKLKKVLAFSKIFSFDPGSSIKLLSSKIEKNISPKYGAILPWQVMPSAVDMKGINYGSSTSFIVQTFVRAATKSCRKYKP